jgi:hypothetical protein
MGASLFLLSFSALSLLLLLLFSSETSKPFRNLRLKTRKNKHLSSLEIQIFPNLQKAFTLLLGLILSRVKGGK